ncbi:MAG: transposase [Gammaproteobacteria bacterium]|nr:transposase [Gammaproteobacteria bacterium]
MLSGYISNKTDGSTYTVGDILRENMDAYRKVYPVTPEQERVVRDMIACRTAQLGGHVKECAECGALQIWYNSCGNRHCNQCGKFKKAQWVEKQKVVWLPIQYFHVTFTTDHAINDLVVANRRVIYDLLFGSGTDTLKLDVGQALYGGDMGITAVLHTWGQKMDPHVHLHCIVTGGALSFGGQKWVASPKNYLCDAIEMSAKYRDRFCEGLRELYRTGKLTLTGKCEGLDVEALVDTMQAKAWEVYIQPFDDAEDVYDYLSRYVHQVALSNWRIVKVEPGKVHFSYKDNNDKQEKGKEKILVLETVEFIRRFLWHVWPDNFWHKRHYGLHHSRARAKKLPQARELLGLPAPVPEAEKLEMSEWLVDIIGEEEIDRCQNCGAVGSLFKRGDFEHLNWVSLIIFGVIRMVVWKRIQP